jgi:hypothetical protein
MIKKKSILFYHQIILVAFISLAILRMGFSILNYLYYPVAGIAVLWSFYILIKHIHLDSYKFFLPVIIFFLLFLAWSFPELIHLNTFLIGEISSLVETVAFIILILYFLSYYKHLDSNWFIMNLRKVFIIIPSLFAFIGLLSFIFNFFSVEIRTFELITGGYSSTTLVSDYNFYSLTLAYALTLILYIYSRDLVKRIQLYNFFFIILSFAVFFSGSRRGIIFLTIFLLIWIYQFFHRKSIVNIKIKRTQLIIGLSVFVFFILFYFGYVNTSGVKKRELVVSTGIDYEFFKEDLGSILHRYSSILDGDEKMSDFTRRAWKAEFDPKKPYTWKTHLDKRVDLIKGNRAEIVPDGSIGLKIDSSSKASTWDGNAYSFTRFFDDTLGKGDIIKASVYCYVSKKFDGSWAIISGDGSIKGKRKTYYNLGNKGQWQKLSLNIYSKGGRVRLHLYLKYPNDKSFKKMNGYVIFAHPDYEVIKNSKHRKNEAKTVKENVKKGFLLGSFFNISIHNYTNSIGSKRIKRWIYAWKIFKNYTLSQKLIGSGFDYLNLYNKKFYPNKDKVDYPHNPIVSAFLYSGIIGGVVYIWFLSLSLLYYYRYKKEIKLLFILYLVTGFFVFFSGNSHFSVPAFSMLSVVPFIYRYYKQKISTYEVLSQDYDYRRK